MRTKKGKRFPKKGSLFPHSETGDGGSARLASLVAEALHEHFASEPHAVKTVMTWTEASDRTVKNWFAGTHGPSGEHLVALARHSDRVYRVFLLLTRHDPIFVDQLVSLRSQLGAAMLAIDNFLVAPA